MIILCFNGITVEAKPLPSRLTNAHVTLIEYYDYECPHCRRMNRVINGLRQHYPNVRFVQRGTPLLNSNSRIVANLALAAKELQPDNTLHQALLSLPFAPTPSNVLMLAKKLKLNTAQLVHVAQSKRVQQQLQRNIQAVSHYAIRGIIHLPTIVVKNTANNTYKLFGEHSYQLLAAIIEQLADDNVQTTQNKNRPQERVLSQ